MSLKTEFFAPKGACTPPPKSARVPEPRIELLDDATIAQIAAGEVIERPLSVVKELVENALDAGASSIVVDCAEGGRDAITVIDDGRGIAPEDVRLAFARHATSKLRSASDLFAVRSLGFRGEGLASVAAAAAVELTSRTASQATGVHVHARGLDVGEPQAVAAPLGTKVVVRDLFVRTPARREFLKSGRAEFARIASFLAQLALGWPRVGFTLRNDERTLWILPAVDDPVDRLEMVFGRDARGAMVPIASDAERGREAIGGYISMPGRDRSNRSAQVFFVNGRLVRSPALSAAWLAAYGSFGMTGRYPFGTISVTAPPEDVDVNVHPTKIEVRFANARAVFEAVRRAVTRALRATQAARAFAVDAVLGSAPSANGGRIDHEGRPLQGESLPEPISLLDEGAETIRVAGQIDRTFIVAMSEGELVLVDQHAAHERIAYEALLDGAGASTATSPLLFPSVVELTPERAAILHDALGDLAEAGVHVEPFGDGAYRLTALPVGYEQRRFDLAAVLDDLVADDGPREGIDHRRRLLATIACHSVVRAGEALSTQEQAALYERLLACREPQTCPHGRPTMLRMDRSALARAFKRL